MRLWRAALCLMLMAPLLFAVDAVDLKLAVPVVAVIVAISIALLNMLAGILSNPQLDAWVKTELREYVAALILVAILTGAIIGSSGVSVALTGKADYIKQSKDIIKNWTDSFDDSYQQIIRASTKLRAAATYAPYINMAMWYVSINYSTNPLAGVAAFFGPLTIATQGLTNAIFLSEAVRMLIAFCSVAVPQALLPLSFCIRLIPFTRKLGSTLIAISIAGYVFLPFSVILVNGLNGAIQAPNPQIADIGKLDANPWAMVGAEPFCKSATMRLLWGLTDPLFAQVVCLPFLLIPIVGAGIYAACVPLVQFVVYPLVSTVFQWVMAILLIVWEATTNAGNYSGDVFDQLYPFLRDVNNLVLLAYLDFIAIGVITMTGARSLSAALGGEWYMAGIQRLI